MKRVAGRRIIAPRRSSSAHLHRSWRAKPPIVAVSAISCAPIRWLFKQPALLVRDDGRVDNCARLSLSGLLFLFGPRGGLSDL